jgi:hypothetical protein
MMALSMMKTNRQHNADQGLTSSASTELTIKIPCL